MQAHADELLEEGPLPDVPETHIQLNYTRLYAPDVGELAGNDQYLYIHGNGLCVVGLAPGHAAFASLDKLGGEQPFEGPESESAAGGRKGDPTGAAPSAAAAYSAGAADAGAALAPCSLASLTFKVGRQDLTQATARTGKGGPFLNETAALCRQALCRHTPE